MSYEAEILAYLANKQAQRTSEIIEGTGISKSSTLRALKQLEAQHKLQKVEEGNATYYQLLVAPESSAFSKAKDLASAVAKDAGNLKDEDKLFDIDVEVNNPIAYLRRWLDKVFERQSIKLSLTIPAWVALLGLLLFMLGVAGIPALVYSALERSNLNRYVDISQLNPQPTGIPTPNPWQIRAYIGTLRYSEAQQAYFLLTPQSDQAIRLQFPATSSTPELLGKPVFISGQYHQTEGYLVVDEARVESSSPNSTRTTPPAN